jgi:hypothetical protein
VLEGGEEGVELGKGGATGLSRLIDGSKATGELTLKCSGWKRNANPAKTLLVDSVLSGRRPSV